MMLMMLMMLMMTIQLTLSVSFQFALSGVWEVESDNLMEDSPKEPPDWP
jgi:hypothetical protein